MAAAEARPAFFRRKAAKCSPMAQISTTAKVRDSYEELQSYCQESAEHAERMINESKG